MRRNKEPSPAEADLQQRCDEAEQIGEQGDMNQAVGLFSDILLDSRSELGADHSRTLIAVQRRAYWTARAGAPAKSIKPCEELIDAMTRVLGPKHLQTLITRRIHAECIALAGDPDRAIELLNELIRESARPLKHSGERFLQLEARQMCETLPRPPQPPEPGTPTESRPPQTGPDTALFPRRYAEGIAMGLNGHPAAAAEAFGMLVADLSAVLGHEHHDTLACRAEHAAWLGMSGDAPRAARLMQNVAETCARLHGDDHPDTIVARAELHHWQSELTP